MSNIKSRTSDVISSNAVELSLAATVIYIIQSVLRTVFWFKKVERHEKLGLNVLNHRPLRRSLFIQLAIDIGLHIGYSKLMDYLEDKAFYSDFGKSMDGIVDALNTESVNDREDDGDEFYATMSEYHQNRIDSLVEKGWPLYIQEDDEEYRTFLESLDDDVYLEVTNGIRQIEENLNLLAEMIHQGVVVDGDVAAAMFEKATRS